MDRKKTISRKPSDPPRRLTLDSLTSVLESNELLMQKPRRVDPSPFRTETDSRKCGPGTLFIAINGVHVDGHSFVLDCLQAGAPYALVEEHHPFWKDLSSHPEQDLLDRVIPVSNTRRAWSFLSAYEWEDPHLEMRLCGITGTNGKTSTVWMLTELLRAHGIPTLNLGTLGADFGSGHAAESEIGHTTPDPPVLFSLLYEALQRNITTAVMEVSSHALVQDKVAPLTFDQIAWTSFSQDHLDYHQNLDEYWRAKWLLPEKQTKNKGLFLVSHRLLERLESMPRTSLHTLTYGLENNGALNLYGRILASKIGSTTLQVHGLQENKTYETPYFGDHALENLLCAIGLFHNWTQSLPVPEKVCGMRGVPGRLETIIKPYAPAIVVDYAHTPDALEKTISLLRGLTKRHLWVVFGCGGDRDTTKRPIMGKLAEDGADHIVLTSDNPRSERPEAILADISKGITQFSKVFIFRERETAIHFAISSAHVDDTVLVAGKGAETYQIIGTTKRPFDDRLVCREALKKRQGEQG